jgi:hypothetical protein
MLGDQRHPALTDTDINCENSGHYLVKVTPVVTQTHFSAKKSSSYCHALEPRHGVWTGNLF